jgi:type II secretion system protein G
MRRGFTLIELLVVIAVIGLLASIVLVSVNSVRVNARNVKVKSDVRQIVTALEMARADSANDEYPSSDGTWRCLKPDESGTGDCWRNHYEGDDDIVAALAPYLANIPQPDAVADPTGCYMYDSYLYRSDGQAGTYPVGVYIIWAKEGSNFDAGECPGYNAGNYDYNYYYCYQFIGVN